jgi:hypothetical protein
MRRCPATVSARDDRISVMSSISEMICSLRSVSSAPSVVSDNLRVERLTMSAKKRMSSSEIIPPQI